jgi:hypothetical protein
MSNYAKSAAGLIGIWFIFTLSASVLHLYEGRPNQPPLALGLTVLTPIVVFAAWFALSSGFRAFALSLDPRILTLLQSWRIAGFVFLVLAEYHILPKIFAMPAGFGDMLVGATAPLAAFFLATGRRRGGFIAWQILGITDLVVAVLTGTLAFLIDPHGVSTAAMAVLPMSLIPTFAVPLFLVLHMLCIAQAIRWQPRASASVEPRHFSATA